MNTSKQNIEVSEEEIKILANEANGYAWANQYSHKAIAFNEGYIEGFKAAIQRQLTTSEPIKDATCELLSDIISWEKDLSEYMSLESILKEKYKITKR